MGLNNKTGGGNKIFLKIFDGKIVQESSKSFTSLQEVKSRENKNGNTVYYTEHDSVSGFLKDANIRTIESIGADIIELSIKDGPESYVLSFGVDTRFGSSFFKKMRLINIDKEIDIRPYAFEDKEHKKVSGLSIYQDGQKLENFYTKEEPKGLPDAKQIRKGKETKWDFTDQINFFYDEFEKFKESFPAEQDIPEASKREDYDDEEESDGLPF